VLGKPYLARQARSLLKFASSTSDPQLAAALIEKAADFTLRGENDETGTSDNSLRPPDIEAAE
jgi:hypothetical protein